MKKFFDLFRCKPIVKRQKRLSLVGEHYDLQSIYERLNSEYFGGELRLSITWFGCPDRKVTAQRVLGQYDFNNQLIKIHRLLDHPRFPSYFISYVVYHEMLHSVLPPLKRKKGRHRIHHVEFKERERGFADYDRARQFEKMNLKLFFMDRGSLLT